MTTARAILDTCVSEGEFSRSLQQAAKLFGYEVYHTHNSRFSPAGFPDLVIARGLYSPVIFYFELKGYDAQGRPGQPSADQQMWIEILMANGACAMCLWPEDMDMAIALLRGQQPAIETGEGERT